MFLRGVIAFALVLLIGYGLIKGYPLFSGPELDIESPATATTSPDGFLIIAGVAHRTETLTLNGGPLLIDERGRFRKEVVLPKGGTTLSFTAEDRFGRTVSATRYVLVPH